MGAERERDEESRERNNEKKGITAEIVHGKTTRDSVYWRWRRCKGSLGPARHQVVEREARGGDWETEEGGREGGRAREAQTRDSMLESKAHARTHTCHMHNKCAPVNNPCFVPTICIQHGLVLAPSVSPSWRARPKLTRQLRLPHALLHILDVATALSRHTSFGMRCLAGVCQAKPFDGANRRGVQFD